jgi:hypothetical protein
MLGFRADDGCTTLLEKRAYSLKADFHAVEQEIGMSGIVIISPRLVTNVF